MATKFRGQFAAKIDVKSRLALPVAVRSVLSEEQQKIVITNSLFKNRRCLDVYSFESWQKLEEKIENLPNLNANVQAFQRFYVSAGQVVEMDAANRVLIPKNLRAFAGIETETILVGMGNKFEIWDLKTWQDLNEELAVNFEDILASVSKFDEEGQK